MCARPPAAAFTDATLTALNFFRALAGLPGDVSVDPNLTGPAQSAALMMAAANQLSHAPGPAWPCRTDEGAVAAATSNLALGSAGAGAITSYMDDRGANNAAVGHRRWLLHPPALTVGTGSTERSNALTVIGNLRGPRPSSPEFVAWPGAGFVPLQLLPTSGRWSFAPNADRQRVDLGSARVTMNGGAIPATVTCRTAGCQGAGDDAIVWEADLGGQVVDFGMADLRVDVAIDGAIVDGVTRSYAYSVTIIDPAAEPVGLVDPAAGRWHLRSPTGVVTSFHYGNPGDVPFVGDWDCDGVDTPGLYRQVDGFAYLRNSNSQGIADVAFFFGDPADVPLAGDFDGDGCDTLALYRPSEARFYVVNQLGDAARGLGDADFSFLFGDPGDSPVAGDWDGDGIDEVGLHRQSTGFFYWRDTLDSGVASGEIFFGDPGDRFVAADWGVVDGRDTPAVFRPSSAGFFVRYTLTQGVADAAFPFGEPGWVPVAGDFGLG